MQYTIIKKGTILPDDFVVNGLINRDKYIVEVGFISIDKWFDELSASSEVTAEIVGAVVIGSDIYQSIRYRKRLETDERWNLRKTLGAKIRGIEIS